ncbi:receptor-like protein EIX1 [Lycium barbarum]|uniref:receptor-like protein EIX1 n=1 Tax=Lycium barbarum TaxID=112863 RepID=UPI00293EF7B1|nr:receptor-like protein EIX1 [Lycium barbarum]
MDGVTLLFLLILVVILDGFSCAQTSSIYSGIHCIESEKNALIKFRQGFKNPSRSMLSWMLEENCCRWEGVECDNSTGHVITLDLHKQFLKGEFGNSLLGLPHLSHLDLSQNDFLGAKIPNFVSRFKNLEYLNLSKTNFRGTVPEHLGNLSRLQFLDLSGDSSLQANNLQWLQHLFSMKILDLSDVDMSIAKNWLHDINLLTSLLELRMSACQLATLPKSLPAFVNFTSLRILDLSLNYFNSPIPSWLFNTSQSLVYLNLTRSKLGGLLPNALGNMHSLRILDLSGNPVNHRHYFSEPPLNWFTGNLPPALPSKLEYLDVSNNQFTGNLPPALPSKLEYLDVSNNHLEGPLAKSIAQLRQLVVLKVAGNSFNDSITEHFLNFSDLRVLDLSSNSFILNVSATWMPRFQLDFLSLQSCRLGTQFPQWIQTQKKLSFIDISNAMISGEVPDWFWNVSAKAYHIDLSQNNFRGEVPEFTERVHLTRLDLSENNFHGPLPHFSPKMMTLILAKNLFNGTIAPVCESLVMNNSLSLLDLSSNSLSGQLSDCWRYGKNLEGLNLAHNNLSWEIPHSIGDLAKLFFLQLQNNSFSKNLPSSLKKITGLKILDVSENSLSGNTPLWLGESLNTLMILKLSRNKFDGNIPWQICQLKYLYMLDLSYNALSGIIPRCLENLHTMSGVDQAPSFTYGPYADYRTYGTFDTGRSLVWDLSMPLKIIDLAENHLSGEIPKEITSLSALVSLNLSRNNFTGVIPRDIGNLQNLEFLDLSRNKLSCTFPPSIAELPNLALANFSFNDLTGKIPFGSQFATFKNNSYVGNPNLCGWPLSRVCSDHLLEDMNHCNNEQEGQAVQHGENNNWLEEFSFYISMGIGFNSGFWVFWATLMLKKSWRYAYMRCLDNMGNKIYVFAAIRLKNNKQQEG